MQWWRAGVLVGVVSLAGCGGKTSSNDDVATTGGTAGTRSGGSSARGGSGGSGRTAPSESWTLQLGDYETDGAYAVGVDPDDNILVLVVNGTVSGQSEPTVAKLDTSGNLLWSAPIAPGVPEVLAVGPYGYTVVAGTVAETDPAGVQKDHLAVTMLDRDGRAEWSSTLGSDGSDSAIDITMGPDGRTFLLWSDGVTSDGVTLVVSELDLNGNVETRTSRPEPATVLNPVLDREGNVFTVTGTDPYSVHKLDSRGNVLWEAPMPAIPVGLDCDDAGNVLVGSYEFETTESLLTKLDADGNEMFSVGLGVGTETPDRLTGDALGRSFTVGMVTYDQGATFDILAHRFDLDGSVLALWSLGSDARDFSYGIATDSTGALIVVGSTEGALPGNKGHGGTDAFVARVAY